MSAKPLAEAYEKLKELRRQREPNAETPREIELILEGLAELPESNQDLIRTLEIKTLADRVFGDEEKAAAWLARPNASLSGQKPADMLRDELGAAVVREMLERIDHGIFA
jgi:Protein of unknown function (DUF2384)